MSADLLLAVVVALVGVVLARSVVAEADAHRLRGDDLWWNPPCPTCGDDLTTLMMRCRANRHPQRGMNAFVLVALPILLVLLALAAPNGWVVPAYVGFGFLVGVLTVTDLDTQLIPNRILVPGTLACGVSLVIGGLFASTPGSVVRALLAGVAYFVVMFILAVVAKGALGYGDVKLAFPLGMFVGFVSWSHVGIAIVGAFLFGGVVSLLLLVTRRVRRTDAIAFGPFMVAGAVASIVFGSAFLDWYRG